jgi:hypothetical protein
MTADVLRRAASLMRERAEAATDGPWVVGDTSAIAGVLNLDADTCAYCRHDNKPSWVGRRDINGTRMRAHVHRRAEPWDGEVYASRDDGDLRVTTGTDEYGYIEPADAQHIASWHPAVALKVARLLDLTAEEWDYYVGEGNTVAQAERYFADQLAVATTYLGESS